jgi:asparagine synthase (glutamine-hydrolysing)
MCGIAGFCNLDGKPIELDFLVSMTRTLSHRGPDEEGYFVNSPAFCNKTVLGSSSAIPLYTSNINVEGVGNVGLGHRRLSIIDLASGHQPLSNEDGSVWITFNGEIYNFQELKEQLEARGHIFRTRSDTETIVHAYEEWGEEAVKKLRGMFAFSVWDEKRRLFYFCRDRVGKKPLYYYIDDKRLIFASEIKAILAHPGIRRDLDYAAISDYLSLAYIPSPKTIFKYIRKLPPACYAVFQYGSMKTHPYWDLSFVPDRELSDHQIEEGILDLLQESTRIRMISEVPLGAFLSGGVDSSAVVACMAGASHNPVITNSISFSHDIYNETAYARMVAEKYRTSHNEFKVTPEAVSIVETLSWHYDEPFADPSSIPTYYVSKMARKNVTVALSGDGGDENFAGYSRYAFDARENRVRNLMPVSLQRSIFGFLRDLYPHSDVLPTLFRGKAFINNVARDPVDAYLFTVSAVHDDYKKEFVNPDIYKEITTYRTLDLFRNLYERAPAADHLSRLQYVDIKTYLCEGILTKVDRASMAVSLEVRCPMLDHCFMEFAARIPKDKKLNGGKGKAILKKALERKLPSELLYRKKMGFDFPVREWFRNEIREYAAAIVVNGPATRDYLNRETVKKVWTEHQNGTRDRSPQLWMVLMLNLWAKRFAADSKPISSLPSPIEIRQQ